MLKSMSCIKLATQAGSSTVTYFPGASGWGATERRALSIARSEQRAWSMSRTELPPLAAQPEPSPLGVRTVVEKPASVLRWYADHLSRARRAQLGIERRHTRKALGSQVWHALGILGRQPRELLGTFDRVTQARGVELIDGGASAALAKRAAHAERVIRILATGGGCIAGEAQVPRLGRDQGDLHLLRMAQSERALH
jgi:hypothetical protein